MRLSLYRRSWSWLAFFALSGCTTFDRPFASSKFSEAETRDRRLIEDANRKAQAGDVDGAKRLLDQLESNQSASGRSHAQTETPRESGIEQVGYQTRSAGSSASQDDMIRELLKNETPEKQAQEWQRYRSMPLPTLRQLYSNQQQAMALGHTQIEQRDATRPLAAGPNAAFGAPDPRSGSAGFGNPWEKRPSEKSPEPSGPPRAPLPEPTTAASLAITPSGVTLGGIQPQPTSGRDSLIAQASASNDLPSINPAPAGATLLPKISPNRKETPSTVAPSPIGEPAFRPHRIEQVNGAIPAGGNQVPASAAQAGASTAPGPNNGNSVVLKPNLTETPRPAVPGADRAKSIFTNPIPGVQGLARTALDRGRNFGGFTPPPAEPHLPVTVPTNELNSLIGQLEGQLAAAAPGQSDAERLDYVRHNVNLRMLYLIAGRNEQALEPIKGLEADDQEFWQHLIWSIANYFDAQGMPRATDRATQTVAELRTAAQKLKGQADLELRSVTFCQRIDSFGNFERLSRDQFPPGSAVLLYAEVENFKSVPAEGDRQSTTLKSTLEFYKAGGDGKLIQSIPFKVTQDYCRTKRRDFYLAFEFSIPQQLETGVYTLVLKTEDQQSQKVATARVNFSVE